jgi:predicted site-specific integrase-resolvase
VVETPRYLRPRQIAKQYGMSVPTLYRWLAQGHITGCSKPGMTLIAVESLERYIATWRQRKGE